MIRGMFKLIAKKVIKLSILATVVLAFLTMGNLYTYKRLTFEKPIARIHFTPVTNQVYDASLRLGNSCNENTYRIYGDEWRIDSQFLKWKSWATLFGLNAMYRIDRLSGRYISVEDENTKSHSAHNLKTDSTLDLSKLAERFNNKFPPVDALYGSSAYETMQANTLYTVFVTQSGLLIRNQDFFDANDNSNCLADHSKWKKVILNLDQKLAGSIGWLKRELI